MPAVIDTNVLFARASARDVYHEIATDIVDAIDHGHLPDVLVTNYVLAETLNLTRWRLGTDISIAVLDRLVEGAHFEIVHTTQTDFTAAQALFRRYGGLSFVDATTAAYMGRTDLDYLYSFDDDFDAVDDIARLETPENPFA